MDFKGLADKAIKLADAFSDFLPEGADDLIDGGTALAEKIAAVVDDLGKYGKDPATQGKLRTANETLSKAVKAKAEATAKRLEGR